MQRVYTLEINQTHRVIQLSYVGNIVGNGLIMNVCIGVHYICQISNLIPDKISFCLLELVSFCLLQYFIYHPIMSPLFVTNTSFMAFVFNQHSLLDVVCSFALHFDNI
eukprot:635928_1